jgi:anti-sigma B factor antagonist
VDFEVEATPTGDGRTTLISVYGELDLATCGQLAPVADEVRSAHRRVILDLTECPFIDSTGLRQVLQIAKPAEGDGASVAIVSPRGSATSELFALTRLDEHLKLFGTVEDASAWLAQPSETSP